MFSYYLLDLIKDAADDAFADEKSAKQSCADFERATPVRKFPRTF